MSDHFGNPLLEQRLLIEKQSFVTRSDQAVIILNLEDSDSTEALLLDPQGHIEHQLKIVISENQVLVITNSEKSTDLLEWLRKMKFRSQIEIEQTDLETFGTFADIEGIVWNDPFSKSNPFSVSYAPQRSDFPYREVVGVKPKDLQEVGLMAYHALRIAAGRPEISDIDSKSLPHEFDWLQSAVHLSKGCYRGQESVAKVHNLGHPPRRLAILHLENGDDLATKGDPVFYTDKEVGKVLASALHYELGSIALVLVNRNTPYLELSVRLGERDAYASQQVLVPADAGKAADLPRPSAFKLSGRKKS
jgi:folate-binding protein YgfZ